MGTLPKSISKPETMNVKRQMKEDHRNKNTNYAVCCYICRSRTK
jgi:hypothetical protein